MITFPLYSSSDTLLPAMSVAVSAYRLSAAAERGKRTNAIRNPSITMFYCAAGGGAPNICRT